MQLEAHQLPLMSEPGTRFNSILVQLEVVVSDIVLPLLLLSFNSILVQLEAQFSAQLAQAIFQFQFHIGAIRSAAAST